MTHVLRFNCPVSQSPLAVVTGGDFNELRARWRSVLLVACEHCNDNHRFFFCDGYVSGALTR